MTTKLLSTLHFLGAVILCTAAVINLLVHPLTVSSTTITIVLVSCGGLLIVQELSRPLRDGPRAHLLSSYLGRAVCFLVATAVTFDRLTDLPCDAPMDAYSPNSTPLAKMSVSAGNTVSNAPTDSTLKSLKMAKRQGPPVFGAAFYVCRSLAPQCTRIDGVPDQPIGSIALVNVSVNKTGRSLVYATCAATLAVSIIYFLLFLLHWAGKVGLSPSMSRTRPSNHADDHEDPHSLRSVEVRRLDQASKDAISSGYRVDLFANHACRCRPVDLYAEQGLSPTDDEAGASRCASAEVSLRASSTPSFGAIRRTYSNPESLHPAQGAASTPDHVFRSNKVYMSSLSTKAASDIAPCKKEEEAALQRRERYGYGYGYGRTDFASGCIMHYPIFSRKKQKERVAQVEIFPTLLPPDFSRTSLNSSSGLTPRKTGKRQASVASKTTEYQLAVEDRGEVREKDDDQAVESGARAVTTECAVQLADTVVLHDDKPHHLPIEPSTNADLPPNGIDDPVTSPHANRKRTKPHKQRRKPPQFSASQTAPQRRLGTAESNRSILSTFSTSRPGTSTSTKSTTSLRTRHRRGLFATLDLHLGHRLSSFSQDVSASGRDTRCSYDSQRSCSAGTFGDGASPLSTPRRVEGCVSPVGPGSPALLALPSEAGVGGRSM